MNIGRRGLSALRYLGGKSVHGTGTGRWIAQLLPVDRGYVEPFAGMLGVLLQRPPTAEIVNDQSGRLINWWRVVRDRHQDLGLFLERTHQRSKAEYLWGVENLDHNDPVTAAAAFTLVVSNTVQAHDTYATPGRFRWTWGAHKWWDRQTLAPLADRMRNVDIECMDACDFITKVARHRWSDRIVMYVDPPYLTSTHGAAAYHQQFDVDRLTALLLAYPGPCAISGYADEWEHLGWVRNELETMTYMRTQGVRPHRTEILWTNYPTDTYKPPQPRQLSLEDGL